jgi:hypothetical protein
MTTTWIERILLAILLVIAGGIVVHAPLTVWLGTTWPHWALVFKAWKELLMGVALLLLIVAAARRQMIGVLLRDRLMQLALAYAVLHVIVIAVSHRDMGAVGSGILIDLRYILYFVLVYGFIRLLPQYRRAFLVTFAGGAAVVVGFGLLQIFVLPRDFLALLGYSKATIMPYLTVDQNPAYIRINSTLRGPNPLGAYIVVVASLLVVTFVRLGRKMLPRQRVLLIVAAAACGVVLGATYSRSSIIGLLVALGVIVVSVTSSSMRKRLLIAGTIMIVLMLSVLYTLRDNSVISSVFWHNSPTTGAVVDSNSGHATSLSEGLSLIAHRPLGSGVGSTGSASLDTSAPLIIENQYLFIAHEIGWLGLALYLWLFIEIMRRLWQRRRGVLALGVFASGCGLAVIGLMLPVWVDDTVSVVWWGLAALAVGSLELGASKQAGGRKHGTRKSH